MALQARGAALTFSRCGHTDIILIIAHLLFHIFEVSPVFEGQTAEGIQKNQQINLLKKSD
jgi:hypothetical protein